MESFTLSSVLWCTKIVSKIQIQYEKIYESNEIFRKMIWWLNNLYCSCKLRLVEPYEEQWVSNSTLLPIKDIITGNYTFYEEYRTNFNDIFFDWYHKYDTIEETVNLFFKNTKQPNCGEMTILKTDCNSKTCYLTNEKIEKQHITVSDTKLLAILYEHPKMNEGIELFLDREWFYANNVLFTPVFIIRMLKYQDKPFVFDKDYKLSFMDSDFASVELDKNSYILLTEDGYETKTNDIEMLDIEETSAKNILFIGLMYSKYLLVSVIGFYFYMTSK